MRANDIDTIAAPAAIEMETAIEEIAKRHNLDEESVLAALLSLIAHKTDVDSTKRELVLIYLLATMEEIASHRVVNDPAFDDTPISTIKVIPS